MLNKPALNKLMDHVDSKYTLVIVAAKRARSVIDNNPEMMATGSVNAVSMALDDIAAGKLHWDSRAAASAPLDGGE